jgi:heterodisulfide reductase subunit A-like polyferredoxin
MAEERARYLIEFGDIPTARQNVPELTVEQRGGNFDEVELGFTQEQAIAEARRCLSCRRCLGCALCLAECHAEAIEFEQVEETLELEVDSIVLAPTAEKFPAAVDEELGFGRYPNVVTSLQFDRILSDDGPYGGLVIRPYDGDIPKSVVFLFPSGDNADLALSLAARQIEAAKAKIEGLEVSVVLPDSIKNAEAEKQLGKDLAASISSVKKVSLKEIEETGNIVIETRGKGQQEQFDMVVLLTGLALPDHIKELNGKLGLEPVGRSFWETEDTSLAETSKLGVFLSGYVFSSGS